MEGEPSLLVPGLGRRLLHVLFLRCGQQRHPTAGHPLGLLAPVVHRRGRLLCLTLLFTIAARLGVTFAVSYLAHLRAKFKTRRARTLIAMKKLLTGPDPRLPELLGKMYTFVSLVLLFSTPMPVLHVFACFYLLTIFWLDKWYLLRVCKKPTPYSDKFIGDTLWWVKWLLLLKLAMAVWAYGSVPGTMLDDALEAVRRSALGVARSAGGAGAGLINSATASSLAFLGVNSITSCFSASRRSPHSLSRAG